MCPLNILISSLARGPLMKWRVLIPLRGVAAPGTGSLFSEALGKPARALQMNCLLGAPQALARRRAEALGEVRGERAWRGLPVGCRTGHPALRASSH